MAKKKLYEVSINVDAIMTMSVHASSREEAAELFTQYLRETEIDRFDLEVDAYDDFVDERDVYETDQKTFWSVDIDDCFEEEEDE